MFLTFDPDIFYYHNILSGEEQYFFGKACYTMTAYVKIRQILCAFEEGKVTKKTKQEDIIYMKKKKWELAAMTAVTAFLMLGTKAEAMDDAYRMPQLSGEPPAFAAMPVKYHKRCAMQRLSEKAYTFSLPEPNDVVPFYYTA